MAKNCVAPVVTTVVMALGLALAAAPLPLASAAGKQAPKEWDGLARVPSKKLALVYVRPGASLAGYKRIRLDPVDVAFDKTWDPNSSQRDPSRRLTKDDLENIKKDVASSFRKVFEETLGTGGYPLVEDDDEDVLRVTAMILDLHITAPDKMAPGRSTTYVQDAGHMTLGIELRDSVTGQVLARAIDRANGSSFGGRFDVANSVTNSAEGRRAITKWAEVLRGALDQVSGKTGAK